MKAYLVVTAVLFGLLAIIHLWRVIEESATLARDPWFLVITAIAALLCGWAVRLLLSSRARAAGQGSNG